MVVQASGLGNFAGSVERAMGKIKGSIDSGSGSSEEKAEEKEPCVMHLGTDMRYVHLTMLLVTKLVIFRRTSRDSL